MFMDRPAVVEASTFKVIYMILQRNRAANISPPVTNFIKSLNLLVRRREWIQSRNSGNVKY